LLLLLLLLLLLFLWLFFWAGVCRFRCRWSGLLDRGDMSRTRTRCHGVCALKADICFVAAGVRRGLARTHMCCGLWSFCCFLRFCYCIFFFFFSDVWQLELEMERG
jgi:hypothetical protein